MLIIAEKLRFLVGALVILLKSPTITVHSFSNGRTDIVNDISSFIKNFMV